MKRWPLIVGLLLPLVVGAVGYRWLISAPERPNILLITVDTLRADHLGAYGYDRPTSPNLDALARDGVVFDNAFTQATLSAPAHATLFTSLETPRHGVINNGVTMDDEQLTLAEVLRASGYETAMFVSHPIVSDEFGLDQGFDVHETHTVSSHGPHHGHSEPPGGEVEAPAAPDAVFMKARNWLSRLRDKPFFVWLHLQHVHKSYDPPDPYGTMFGEPPPSSHDLRCLNTLSRHRRGEIRLTDAEMEHFVALYDGEIAYVDAQLGDLLADLDILGIADSTIVMLTADHGENLFADPERRTSGHGRVRRDEVLRIPLIVRGPLDVAPGTRVDPMVGLLDLAPTLLDLAGVRRPGVFKGTSLVKMMRGDTRPVREDNFTCTFHTDGTIRLSVRDMETKLACDKKAASWDCELYDLMRDPRESRDLSDDPAYAEVARARREELEQWFVESTNESELLARQPKSKRALSLLRRAGYLEEDSESSSSAGGAR